MKSKVLLLSTLIVLSTMGCSTAKDCVECTKKTLGKDVQPDSKPVVDLKKDVEPSLELAAKGPLVITKEISRAPAMEKQQSISKEDYQEIFCMKFSQISENEVASLILEMEKTPYQPVDDYFTSAACTPRGWGGGIKSPMAQAIADDPSGRTKMLETFWKYYSKKRKEPSKFLDLVNAKNTQGETLLDYIETMFQRGMYSSEESKESVQQIVKLACSRGAVYSKYKDKKCP